MCEQKTRHRLTYEDRKLLEQRLSENVRIIEIAEELGVCRATLYKEIARCPAKPYSASASQLSKN